MTTEEGRFARDLRKLRSFLRASKLPLTRATFRQYGWSFDVSEYQARKYYGSYTNAVLSCRGCG
jgi:hypothetical protein